MKVTIIASGSSGNCIHLQSGNASILIDAGIAKTKIEQRLLDNGIIPGDLEAIFITHGHKDHCQGLPLANKYKTPVYGSEGTWKTVKGKINVDEDLYGIMTLESPIYIGNELVLKAFRTHHDDYDSYGFTVDDGDGFGGKVSICLDTGKVDNDMLGAMADSDIYIIESNHDPALVEASNYPISTQARILSDIGHLSNQQTAAALKRLVKGKGERIYLTHLSSSNNTPMHARAEVMRALREKGSKDGEHYFLEVCSD